MSSSFGSRDLCQSEKKRTACKAEQIKKMTTISTQSGPRLLFWAVILWVCSDLQAVFSFSAWEKSRDSTPYSKKSRGHVEHLYW